MSRRMLKLFQARFRLELRTGGFFEMKRVQVRIKWVPAPKAARSNSSSAAASGGTLNHVRRFAR